MSDPHAERRTVEPADPNWRHPVEDMEPMEHADGFRECALKFSEKLNDAVIFIAESRDARLAAWQAAYAFGLPICEGVSMTERADMLGVCRAAFSKGAKKFQRRAHLPPSEHMKASASTSSYAAARDEQLSSPIESYDSANHRPRSERDHTACRSIILRREGQ